MPDIRTREPLAQYTTFGVGGTAEKFVSVANREELLFVLQGAAAENIPYWLLAGGSNVVCSDAEVPGLCIRVTSGTLSFDATLARAEAGVSLAALIEAAMGAGLTGLETLSGIPGTVGGAIVGNAGAYGQTISGPLVRVEIYDRGTRETRWIGKDECGFSYRDSRFKTEPWILLQAEFQFQPGETEALRAKSHEIIALREKKYPPGIRCPGSFFKNVFLENLSPETQEKVPHNRDFYGKVPAWFFLNEVGARGMTRGGIRIADIHGNLILNDGGATYADITGLASELKKLVKDHFNVDLEEEVRYIE